MRFNTQVGDFPLPILREPGSNGNYIDSEFTFGMEVNSNSSPHKVDLKFSIDHPEIGELIKKGFANPSLAIHCESTYFYEMIDLADKYEQSVNFDESSVFGTVYFTLIIKATKGISSFKPTRLEEGFEGLSFDVRKGDILAISDEYHHHYHLPPMPMGADIFELVEEPELDPLSFLVDLDDQKIIIGAGKQLNALVQKNMSTTLGKTNNICSIYLPALVEVLYRMQSEDFGGRMWFEAISSALNGIGVSSEEKNWEPLTVAQKLLKYPYGELLGRVDL